MPSIGTQLRAGREAGGLSVADVAGRLHMRAMFVDAIERDDWRVVGAAVYVRGFIRNYARLVGVEPQPLVDAFNEHVQGELSADAAGAPPPAQPGPRFRYPLLLAAMSFVALALVARIVWTIATPNAAGHDEVRPQQAEAAAPARALPASQDGSAPAMSIGVPHAADGGQGVDVRLALTQPCWLSVDVDGRRVVYETLPAGTVREFRGVREISLRAGNAGGVIATINGEQIGTLGKAGEVQDRVFAVTAPPAPAQGGARE